MGNQGTTVKLRTKKLKSGKFSYYLQFYFPHTRKKKKEYLGLYLFPNPKDPIQKDHNKEIKQLAESILSKKIIEIQEGRFGFMSKEKLNILFLSYFETIMEKKKNSSSNSNFSNWRSTYEHIKRFTREDLKLSEIDHKYLNDLKDYLKNGNISRGGRKLTSQAHTLR